jgi:hypothetical protein
MATKAEIQEIIKNRLVDYYIDDLVGTDVKTALAGNILDQEFDAIAGWLQERNYEKIGRFIGSKVKTKILTDADTEAAAMLNDDQLSLTEISRVLRI